MLKPNLPQTSVGIKHICELVEMCLTMENCSFGFLDLRNLILSLPIRSDMYIMYMFIWAPE